MFDKKMIPVLLIATCAALAACEQKPSTATEEAAIGAQNAKWLDAIAKHDADTVMMMYASDGELMPPNSPKAAGRDAIKDAWGKMFEIPGFGLTFTTDKLTFSQSGDLAVDVGTYNYKSEAAGSSVSDAGKYVVTWVKRDGTWQVLTDMFSSNAPMLPPTPTVPPASEGTIEPSTTTPVEPSAATPMAPPADQPATTPTAPPATTTPPAQPPAQ
ncbi:MAG: SgcJ/EcaC family oxidoreductase [Alphaproteobacteria bacterium]|nr:SgcJ/EcaC family oxidoreductase [Alphaproteobacteria bacterium]